MDPHSSISDVLRNASCCSAGLRRMQIRHRPRQENVQDALADREYADVVHIVSESLPYEAFLVLVSQHQSSSDANLHGD